MTKYCTFSVPKIFVDEIYTDVSKTEGSELK